MRRILLIEDDPEQARLAERLIRGDGHDVAHASDFATGVNLAHASDFDVAVVDLGLPDAKDFATVARFHELGIPIVAMTGSGNDDLISAVRKTGASYVGKPGGDLLLIEIWSQINYRDASNEASRRQREGQSRLMAKQQEEEQAIKETTPVTIGLARVIAIVVALLTSAVGVTWYVSEKINAGVLRINAVDTNISSIRTEFLAYVAVSSKRQDALDAIVQSERVAKDQRLLEWSKWRWIISRDVRSLGEKSGVPIFTKDPE